MGGMKFNLQCVRNNGARLGKLVEVGCHGNHTIDTPACMMYTRLGSVPHLSSEMLQKIQTLPAVTHMPLTIIAALQENIAGFKEGMAKFAALPPDSLVFTSVYDPAVEIPSGFNDRQGVGVFGRGGKVKLDVEAFMKVQETMLPDWFRCMADCETKPELDVEAFMKVQEAVLPDWFQCMADCDTNKESSRKRAIKSVDRTLSFLDDIVDKHKNSEKLKKSCMFGSLVGGYDKKERERCAKETVARNVDGYVIEGFHSMGPKAENFSLEDAAEIIKLVTDLLPDDRPRMMLSVWRPDKVLQAIEMGLDLFDASYPYLMTEQGCALVFDYQYTTDPESTETGHTPGQGFTINLKDQKYFDDFGPLLENCTCYTCKTFTRAYVNHLLNTSELLASILLMLHNLHHYTLFFVQIREALADDKFDCLKTVIQTQVEIKTDT